MIMIKYRAGIKIDDNDYTELMTIGSSTKGGLMRILNSGLLLELILEDEVLFTEYNGSVVFYVLSMSPMSPTKMSVRYHKKYYREMTNILLYSGVLFSQCISRPINDQLHKESRLLDYINYNLKSSDFNIYFSKAVIEFTSPDLYTRHAERIYNINDSWACTWR